MVAHLVALTIDANDPSRLARFWAGLLHRDVIETPNADVLLPASDDAGFPLRFAATTDPKTGPNRMHFDLTSSSAQEQLQTVDRALALGGRHIDVGQLPEEEHVVLSDPEGNEFCVIEPGNNFLAGTAFIGALSCDGSQAVGYFWSSALGWPLVWDQDQETAIQSPRGGSKISWGGPPVAPKTGKNRWRFDIGPTGGADQHSVVDRLASLGAFRLAGVNTRVDAVPMADPDGNEFSVVRNAP